MRHLIFFLLMRMAAALRVALLTDVEGNWQYVRNVVQQSSCLKLVEDSLELQDDCMLVFGGDAGDKGAQTLRCGHIGAVGESLS